MKKIIKGIGIWLTAFSISAEFMVLEWMIETSEWLMILGWTFGNIALFLLCNKFITYKELYKLSGTQWIENKIAQLEKRINETNNDK